MSIFQHSGQTKRRITPQTWLMTDNRMGRALLPSIQALPRGSGVVFRHYDLEHNKRLSLFRQVMAIARRRGLLVMLAGPAAQARDWGADGYHNRRQGQSKRHRAEPALLHSAPVHNLREIASNRGATDFYFLSPVYPTISHPGGRALGALTFQKLGSLCDAPVIALGGMTPARFAMLRCGQVKGWAGISALKR